MTTFKTIFIIIFTTLTFAPVHSPAQNRTTPGYNQQLTPAERAAQQKNADEAAATGCAVCGGGLAVMVGITATMIALNIALLIWVARDAKSRGMDSSILWMLLVMFTSFVGLIIYIFSRPQGDLVQCAHCKGKRLSVSATCPHCHHA